MYSEIPVHRRIVFCCAVVGIIISLVHILFCTDAYTDISAFYGPIAAAFAKGDWAGAYNGIIGPLNPALAAVFVKMGMHPFNALMTVSSIFYVLCIFPLYGMLRILLKNRNYAAWGCFMYILTPKIIRFGCTGLLNSGRNFFLAWAIYLILSFFEKVRAWKLALLGVCLAGLALNRGEGLLYAPLFALWLLLIPLQKAQWRLSWNMLWTTVGRVVLVALVTIVCISPRMFSLYRETGIPSTDTRQSQVIGKALAAVGVKVQPPAMKKSPAPPAPPVAAQPEVAKVSAQPEVKQPVKTAAVEQSGAESVKVKSSKPAPAPLQRKKATAYQAVLKKCGKLVDCFGRGAYWVYFGFSLLGIAILIYRKEFAFKLWLPISVIFFSTLIFVNVVLAYRYFTLNAMLMLPFSFTGLCFIYQQAVKLRLKYIAVIALIIIGIFQAKNGMEKVLNRKYDYEKGIGDWLNEHRADFKVERGGVLKMISPKPQYSFWSGIPYIRERDPARYVDPGYLRKEKVNIAVMDVENPDILTAIEGSSLYVELKQPYRQMRVFVVLPQENK
ncbi:glycosyltransferase family 39 protein [Lentisphaerota bacterium ZTH]|nr:glycosyltransferase family 39 protein [Lentisphaerota bacterium]WET05491.1 glycosyltransferase family 39 protein [Lentisphaerota bacterium ZTH]